MPPKASTSAQPPKLQPQDVPAVFQRYRADLQNLAQKIGELESEAEEHSCVIWMAEGYQLTGSLVLSTLQPLRKTTPDRKCYRLIGGILVERTVEDVIPALETNFTGIKEVLESLMKSYKSKDEEFGAFRKEYNIQMPS